MDVCFYLFGISSCFHWAGLSELVAFLQAVHWIWLGIKEYRRRHGRRHRQSKQQRARA